jgi:hypothetical protein
MKEGISEEFKVSRIKTMHNYIPLQLELEPMQDGLIMRGAVLKITHKGIEVNTGYIVYPELWKDTETLIPFVINEWAYLF